MINVKINNKMVMYIPMMLLFSVGALSISVDAAAMSFDSIVQYFSNYFSNNSGQSGKGSIVTMFANFDSVFRVGIGIALWIARFIAMWLLYKAFMKLIRVSDQKETIGGFFLTFISAILMFSIVDVMDLMSQTMGLGKATSALDMVNGTSMVSGCSASSNLNMMGSCSNNSVWDTATKGIVAIITMLRLVGIAAVIRALLALHEIGENKGQATYTKVWVALGAGTILYNLIPFAILITGQAEMGQDFFKPGGGGSVFIPKP